MIAELSGIPDARVFFTTSGTEANEAALLVASSYRRSSQIVAVRNSYHGRSFATIGITGNRGWSPSSLTPFQVSYMQSGYRFRSPFRDLDDAAFTDACAEDLRDVIATQTAGDIAALIAEPVQGVGGFAIPPDGFFGPDREGVSRVRHALHRRRGPDGLGAHRRPLLGPPGPRHHPRPA